MGCGPVQILVVGFSDDSFARRLLPELQRLRDGDAIGLLDLRFVTKDEAGNLVAMDIAALAPDESEMLGSLIEALIGFGPSGTDGISVGAEAGVGGTCAGPQICDTWAISDAIPPGVSAAVLLIEHRWAVPLRAAINDADGFALEDTWVHARDLAAVGTRGATTGSPGHGG